MANRHVLATHLTATAAQSAVTSETKPPAVQSTQRSQAPTIAMVIERPLVGTLWADFGRQCWAGGEGQKSVATLGMITLLYYVSVCMLLGAETSKDDDDVPTVDFLDIRYSPLFLSLLQLLQLASLFAALFVAPQHPKPAAITIIAAQLTIAVWVLLYPYITRSASADGHRPVGCTVGWILPLRVAAALAVAWVAAWGYGSYPGLLGHSGDPSSYVQGVLPLKSGLVLWVVLVVIAVIGIVASLVVRHIAASRRKLALASAESGSVARRILQLNKDLTTPIFQLTEPRQQKLRRWLENVKNSTDPAVILKLIQELEVRIPAENLTMQFLKMRKQWLQPYNMSIPSSATLREAVDVVETRLSQLESNARKPAALSVWWDAFSKCSMAAKIPYQIRWRIMMLALDCEVVDALVEPLLLNLTFADAASYFTEKSRFDPLSDIIERQSRDIHKHIKYLGEALELHTRCKETVSSSRALEQSRALSDVLYELKLAEPLSELGSGSRIASRDQRALQLPNGAVVEFPPPFDTYVESAAPQYTAATARNKELKHLIERRFTAADVGRVVEVRSGKATIDGISPVVLVQPTAHEDFSAEIDNVGADYHPTQGQLLSFNGGPTGTRELRVRRADVEVVERLISLTTSEHLAEAIAQARAVAATTAAAGGHVP